MRARQRGEAVPLRKAGRPLQPRLILYGYRWCFACDGWLPVTKFGALENRCKPCISQRSMRYAKQRPNPAAYQRAATLWSKYRMRAKDWDALFADQNGRCASCQDKTSLVVDHDHVTGQVRALLCSACNTAEGMLAGSPIRARALADYMERFAAPF